MSIRVMSRVWEQSKQREGALLVMLAIADYADDEGIAYPSVNKLAQKSRLSERQVHYVLGKLQKEGELAIEKGGGRSHTNIYRVQFLQGAISAPIKKGCNSQHQKGAIDDTKRVQPIAPEPSIEPSEESLTEDFEPKGSQSSVPKTQKKRVTEITDEFLEAMHQRFDPIFGIEGTSERIEEALGHKAITKSTNKQAYLRGWLRRDAEKFPAARASPNGKANVDSKQKYTYENVMGIKK